ncbi:hypothetical protein RYH80_18555 [Halobaculum sp. MBLA0147]|uniref:hypothetical protein n=1 Tax=Halobaculum sp. MBLA0147 TaxID=3079934 RepID=UPI0035239C35
MLADGFEIEDGIPLPFIQRHWSSRRDASTARGDIRQYARLGRVGSQPYVAEVATVTRDHDRFGGATTHSPATTALGTVIAGVPGRETYDSAAIMSGGGNRGLVLMTCPVCEEDLGGHKWKAEHIASHSAADFSLPCERIDLSLPGDGVFSSSGD